MSLSEETNQKKKKNETRFKEHPSFGEPKVT